MRRLTAFVWIATGLCPAGALLAADKPASTGRMVSIEVVIAQFADRDKTVDQFLHSEDGLLERIDELEKQGQIAHLTRMRLATLDQSQAQLQFGERTPVATGRARAGGFGRGGGPPGDGPTMTSYTMENIGTLIGVTPQVEDDGSVSLKMEIEKSQLAPLPPGEAPDATGSPTSRTKTLVTRSTVRLRSGQTAIVGQSQTLAKAESGQSVIVVTARVSDAPGPARTAEAAQREMRIYSLQNASAQQAVTTLSNLFKEAALQIEADVRTNSVLVHGPKEAQSEVEAVLRRLDEQEK